MGNNSEFEVDVDVGADGPEQEDVEEAEADSDTPSSSPVPVDDTEIPVQQVQTSHSNGNANVNVNGNTDEPSAKRALETPSPNATSNGVSIAIPIPSAEPATPRSSSLLKRSATSTSTSTLDAPTTRSSNGVKKLKIVEEEDEEAGTKEEQLDFMKELEAFYKDRFLDFKPPKFYGEPLNLLKLWRAVIQLGGYDRVTASKLWRQVGESFHPPKTCTTVSWTFRIFYEKALLEYEKHKKDIGELEFPGVPIPESTAAENEGSAYQNTGSGRARRDAAARAMQGWHAQRFFGFGEVGEPIIKDKSLSSSQKREKHLKNIGVKQKKTSNLEPAENELHAEANKQLVTTVVDVGPPADWVKINVRESKDCFEVYALVPGLLREEPRSMSLLAVQNRTNGYHLSIFMKRVLHRDLGMCIME